MVCSLVFWTQCVYFIFLYISRQDLISECRKKKAKSLEVYGQAFRTQQFDTLILLFLTLNWTESAVGFLSSHNSLVIKFSFLSALFLILCFAGLFSLVLHCAFPPSSGYHTTEKTNVLMAHLWLDQVGPCGPDHEGDYSQCPTVRGERLSSVLLNYRQSALKAGVEACLPSYPLPPGTISVTGKTSLFIKLTEQNKNCTNLTIYLTTPIFIKLWLPEKSSSVLSMEEIQ